MSDLPKMLSKREIELQEVKYIFSLRAERDELQEQLNTAKKELTEEIESIEEYLDKYGMSSYGANTRQAYLEGLKKALAAIGGDDE